MLQSGGIPSAVPGASAAQVLESAKRAEALGFASLGVIDRLVYPNLEPLVTLAAAAAVTERIRLTTAVLIAPYRQNAALLAKQAASVDVLSGGRLVLGIAIGARADDYEASGVSPQGRGRRLEEMLEEMNRVWAGEERGFAGAIGPSPPNGRPAIVTGGNADAAFERAARHGDGWIAGGGTPDGYDRSVEKMRDAWRLAGRTGTPTMMAMAYCALGPNARAAGDAWVHSYYGFAGAYAETVARRVAVDAEGLRELQQRYADAGCDELILFPCSADPEQVDMLADAVL
jgi:alkanesulfonate monooxygenase SsuD/methylene tetrahydromethanopterin reductase-like flavin-dependent oxidoreductase (luciferase family)